ncbi:MAG: thioesterase, partial [Defluviitaleaceae bacterium]|nr:thioesterase [Defluviitaleaceae bacterium]
PIEVCQANSNHPPKRGDCDTNIAERFNWCRNKIAGMQNYTGEGGKNNEAPCAEGSSSIMPEKIVLPTPGETPFQLFSEYTHIVRHAEVDTNRHMNNSMYGDLIGNALFPSMEAAESAGDWREVQINYLAETRFGEEIKVSAYRENNQFIVVGDAGGKVSFAAKVLSCCKV